jgi:hypothetical protein
MYSIKVGRFEEDPEAQGVIRPEDESWQLVIDKEGYPHLYIKVQFEPELIEGEEKGEGLFCIEDMLPEGVTIPDLMKSKFGGKLSPDEEKKAFEAHMARKESTGIPCPR